MSGIRIRVGAALDSSALNVFDPLEKRAAQAARNIQKSLNEGLDGKGPVRAAKLTGDALDRELDPNGEQDGPRSGARGAGHHERGGAGDPPARAPRREGR